MRLIDADILFDAMEETEWYDNADRDEIAERLIMDAPSIDIVRCSECKYWEESQYYPKFMVCTYVKGATFTRQHDDFCSRGERKSDE